MSRNVTVVVAKGRVLEEVMGLWQTASWEWPDIDSRQLWFPATSERPGLIVARGQDIPEMVRRGIAGLGIVGRDILAESLQTEVLEVLDLGIASCRMVLAGLNDEFPRGPVAVATKYPHVARSYWEERGQKVDITQLAGSVELAPHLGIAPYIIDLVQTGTTLRAHHLREIETLFSSTARLIANPIAWRLNPEVQEITAVLQRAVRAVSQMTRDTEGRVI